MITHFDIFLPFEIGNEPLRGKAFHVAFVYNGHERTVRRKIMDNTVQYPLYNSGVIPANIVVIYAVVHQGHFHGHESQHPSFVHGNVPDMVTRRFEMIIDYSFNWFSL